MKDLLLVTDIQNVYFPDQSWVCPSVLRTFEMTIAKFIF